MPHNWHADIIGDGDSASFDHIGHLQRSLLPKATTASGELSLVLSRNNSYNQLTAAASQPGSRRMTGENGQGLQEIAATSRRSSISLRRQSISIVAQRRLLMGLLHGHNGSISSLRTAEELQQHQHHQQQQPQSLPKSARRQSRAAATKNRHHRHRRPTSVADNSDHDFEIIDAADSWSDWRRHHDRLANRHAGDDNLATVLSAFYAKLLVVLGIAFPVTGVLSPEQAHASFYQGFYLYLYVVSVLFVAFMYTTHLRARAVVAVIDRFRLQQADVQESAMPRRPAASRYGSFYLRAGAIAFGIGSMVYSGLEFGQYFELRGEVADCQNVLVALTPASRTVLSIVQMQFIFLNTREFAMSGWHRVAARFGLMHMVATNLCEWLYVLVEETKHEIVHLQHQQQQGAASAVGGALVAEALSSLASTSNLTSSTPIHQLVRRATASYIVVECRRTNIMGRLVQNASPFLFPCTIEYSLICAVILFEMWKHMHPTSPTAPADRQPLSGGTAPRSSAHHFSVDCSRAHRGMFAGILVIVLTIIALIMFFVLAAVPEYRGHATLGVTIAELALYVLTIGALGLAYAKMRDLRFDRTGGGGGGGGWGGIPLDCTLLLMAQSGCFIYSMFSIIGAYFAHRNSAAAGAMEALVAEVFGVVQTAAQTIFVLNAWYRRLDGPRQAREMPGRETITFLLVANMAMWCVNTLVKSRAAFRPTHLRFFGAWAWTIITHVSMPLAIFYRFHSTICLFEIWKTTYKVRPEAGEAAATAAEGGRRGETRRVDGGRRNGVGQRLQESHSGLGELQVGLATEVSTAIVMAGT